jgi:hypothetical protein
MQHIILSGATNNVTADLYENPDHKKEEQLQNEINQTPGEKLQNTTS